MAAILAADVELTVVSRENRPESRWKNALRRMLPFLKTNIICSFERLAAVSMVGTLLDSYWLLSCGIASGNIAHPCLPNVTLV